VARYLHISARKVCCGVCYSAAGYLKKWGHMLVHRKLLDIGQRFIQRLARRSYYQLVVACLPKQPSQASMAHPKLIPSSDLIPRQFIKVMRLHDCRIKLIEYALGGRLKKM
jgi:hypothetical protein